MILVVLGTQDMPFTRLLIQIDSLINEGKIKDEVVVQSGFTKYNSNNMKIIGFISPEEIDELYDKADFIISHGGTGSLMKAIKKRKKVIAVPRMSKYNEHNDDHQLEIVRLFQDRKYLLAVENLEDLGEAIEKVKSFQPEEYISKKEMIIKTVEKFIESI